MTSHPQYTGDQPHDKPGFIQRNSTCLSSPVNTVWLTWWKTSVPKSSSSGGGTFTLKGPFLWLVPLTASLPTQPPTFRLTLYPSPYSERPHHCWVLAPASRSICCHYPKPSRFLLQPSIWWCSLDMNLAQSACIPPLRLYTLQLGIPPSMVV